MSLKDIRDNVRQIETAIDALNAELDQELLKEHEEIATNAPLSLTACDSEVVKWTRNVDFLRSVWVTAYSDPERKNALFSEDVVDSDEFDVDAIYQPDGDIYYEIKPIRMDDDDTEDWKYAEEYQILKSWINPRVKPDPVPAGVVTAVPPKKGEENVIKLADLEHVTKRFGFDGKDKDTVTIENKFFDLDQFDSFVAYIKDAKKVVLRNVFFRNGKKSYVGKNWNGNVLYLRGNIEIDAKNVGTDGGHVGIMLDNNKSCKMDGFTATRAFRHNLQMVKTIDNPNLSGHQLLNFIVHGEPVAVHEKYNPKGSQDLMNAFDCSGRPERRIEIGYGMIYQGYGKCGSAIPLGDGGDIGDGTTGRIGGRQHLHHVGIVDSGNKATAISGGGDNLIEHVWFYQDDTAPQAQFATCGIYAGDFTNEDQKRAFNFKDTGFKNNVIRHCRGTWIGADGRPVHFEDFTKGVKTKRLGRVFEKQASDSVIVQDCEFGKVTKQEVVDYGLKMSANAPVFIDLDGKPICDDPIQLLQAA